MEVVVALDVPHVWLANIGGGGGLQSVDDLEVNFAEREAVRMADHVLLPGALLPKTGVYFPANN